MKSKRATKIRVVVKEPGKKPKIRQVDNELEVLQEIVGGYIECVTVREWEELGQFAIVCDGQGKLKGKLPNFRFGQYGLFAGTVAFISADGPDFINMPEVVAKTIVELFEEGGYTR